MKMDFQERKAIIFLSIFMSTAFCMDTPPGSSIDNTKSLEPKKIVYAEKPVFNSRCDIKSVIESPIEYLISREQLIILFLIKAINELEEPNKSEN